MLNGTTFLFFFLGGGGGRGGMGGVLQFSRTVRVYVNAVEQTTRTFMELF